VNYWLLTANISIYFIIDITIPRTTKHNIFDGENSRLQFFSLKKIFSCCSRLMNYNKTGADNFWNRKRPVRTQIHDESTSDFKMEEIVRTLFENGRVTVSEGGRENTRPRWVDNPERGQCQTFSCEISAAQHLGGLNFHAKFWPPVFCEFHTHRIGVFYRFVLRF